MNFLQHFILFWQFEIKFLEKIPNTVLQLKKNFTISYNIYNISSFQKYEKHEAKVIL